MYQSAKEMAFKAGRKVAAVGAAVGVSAAQAAGNTIDVSSVTQGVTDAGVAITTVGVSILGVCVLIAAFLWVRRPIK
jgi:hypothetical protein